MSKLGGIKELLEKLTSDVESANNAADEDEKKADDFNQTAVSLRMEATKKRDSVAPIEAMITALSAMHQSLMEEEEKERTFLLDLYTSTSDDDTITSIVSRAAEINFNIEEEASEEVS